MSQPVPNDMAAQLKCWAEEEMHFRPQGHHVNAPMPTEEAFRSVCRGQMLDVWKFVLDHARSAQTVQKVKGNLMLKTQHTAGGYKVKYQGVGTYSEDRAQLLDQKRHLSAELASGLSAVGHVERDVERLRTDILNTEQTYSESQENVGNIQRRSALLEVHSQQVEEEVNKYKEYSNRMKGKARSVSVRDEEATEYFSRQSDRPGDKAGLETASTKAVRESCFLIGQFLQQLLEGAYGSDRDLMQKEKEQLWSKIEDVFMKFSANQVVGSLCVLTQDTVLDVRDKTKKVNILRDAENLRFKYEKGQLTDISSPPSVLQSVRGILTESQRSHIQDFLETEKNRNKTFHLKDRVSNVMELIGDALRSSFHGNPAALELAKTLFDTEVHTAADRAALQALDEQTDELRNEISRAAREKEKLYVKYQKIQDFKKLADSKQNLIRVLVKQNSAARGRLDLQTEEIGKYIQSSLSEHEAKTLSVTQQLKDSVATEVDNFAKLMLPFLMFTVLESGLRLAVLDLSIHRLQVATQSSTPSGGSGSQGSVLQQVLKAVEFPIYKAPECLLPQVVELQREICDLEATLASHKALVHSIEDETDDRKSTVDHIAGLCEEVREHDQKQLDQLLPQLNQRLTQATQAFSDCLRLKDLAHDWWEQPSQTVTPWLQVDDSNLQQWRDKWTIAVTRLRQLQIDPQTSGAKVTHSCKSSS